MLTVLGCILGPVAVLGVWAGNEVSDTGRWVATVEPRISSLLDAFGPQFSSAVTGFIHSTAQKVISSPAVAKIWVQVNTVGHQALVKVLSGDGNGAVSTSNGQITLNLGLFIAVVKQDLVDHGFSLASNIPIISPTVALFQADNLGKAQAGYRLIKALKIVLPILALSLLAAGVYAALGRRRPPALGSLSIASQAPCG